VVIEDHAVDAAAEDELETNIVLRGR